MNRRHCPAQEPQSEKAVEPAVHRDNNLVAGAEHIPRKDSKLGRAVEEHEIIPVSVKLLHCVAEGRVPAHGACLVKFCHSEVKAARDDVNAFLFADYVVPLRAARQKVKHLCFGLRRRNAKACAKVALRVHVDDSHTITQLGQRNGDVLAGCSFSHAAFEVAESYCYHANSPAF